MKTRLTEFFGIEHPIVSAPMALISGGKLAAAVTSAGGLGLIGGGYGDSAWLEREFGLADGARVGCGFITWSLARTPELLDETLQREPATVMLSFGELQPFAERIHAAGIPLMAQVQTLEHARRALDAGAEIVVAQGGLYPDGTILQAQDGDEVKYAPFAGGEDGALAVLFQTVDAREADVRATGMVRDCELQRAMLRFVGEIGEEERNEAYAGLAAAHVVMR